jgi:hypothetical protein
MPHVTASHVASKDEEAVVRDIVRALREYLDRRPDAADSIKGMHRWWLPASLQDEAPSLVHAAVAELVADHTLRRVVQEDGRVIYSSGRRPSTRTQDSH